MTKQLLSGYNHGGRSKDTVIVTKSVQIFGEKLAALRLRLYYSQEELAQSISMSKGSIARLEQQEQGGMLIKNFRRLAELARTTPDKLRAEIGVPESGEVALPAEELVADQPAAPGTPARRPAGSRRVPRFHSISATRRDERTGEVRDEAAAPDGSKAQFAVRVDGDSMEPKYPDGSDALFSREEASANGLVDGADYILWFTNSESYFAQVLLDRKDRDRVILRKRNPDRMRFPDRVVHRREIASAAKAVGVVWE